MPSPLLKKIAIGLVSGVLIASIWLFWLVSGLRGAWALHHKVMWNDYSQGPASNFTFALATTPDGGTTPIAFSEIAQQDARTPLSFAPPPHLIGRTGQLKSIASAFARSRGFHLGDPTSATLVVDRKHKDGFACEICVRFHGGGELIWRYIVTGNSVTPVKWYEIHDTAGIVMLPMALGIWLLCAPLAIALTWLVSRARNRLIEYLL